jgi:uncharacterized protein
MARRAPALLALALAACGCGRAAPEPVQNVPVRVERVALDSHDVPVVVLEEEGGTRLLPIWIGTAEARSIAVQIEARRPPRPNTHDLARSVIQGLHGEVVRVVVTELHGGTYYALLTLRSGNDLVDIDARPSDAIAIALRAGAPIYVRASLFDSAGELPDEPEQGAEGPEDGRAI